MVATYNPDWLDRITTALEGLPDSNAVELLLAAMAWLDKDTKRQIADFIAREANRLK